jgi:hypothetical protein
MLMQTIQREVGHEGTALFYAGRKRGSVQLRKGFTAIQLLCLFILMFGNIDQFETC